MPSPFPGMDPYLEDPGLWPDVHHEIISVARELLNERIRPKYIARIEERVYVADEDDPDRRRIVPDVRVTAMAGREHDPAPGGPAVLDIAEPVRARTREDLEVREARIELIDRSDRSVVTVIEVVSPANKAASTRGRESFASKRSEVLYSESHWVEIDLLRHGASFTARKRLKPHHYLVHVSRVEDRPEGLLWPITLAHRLPVVGIPLRGGDPDAGLDLQRVLDVGYARAGYESEIDYREPARPPLEPPWSDWADALLKERGLR